MATHTQRTEKAKKAKRAARVQRRAVHRHEAHCPVGRLTGGCEHAVGLFSVYTGSTLALRGAKPDDGWACCIELRGPNAMSGKIEAHKFIVQVGAFESPEDAHRWGKSVIETAFGVEYTGARDDEFGLLTRA